MNESDISTEKSTPFPAFIAARERLARFLEQESWLKMTPAILLVAFVFSEIQWSTTSIIGVDGHFHIKFADSMRRNIIPAPIYFPWLPLTILNPAQFTDHHLLFHVLLEPFTLLDLRVGAKLAAASFASIAALVIYGLLFWQRVRWSFLWLLLLLERPRVPLPHEYDAPASGCSAVVRGPDRYRIFTPRSSGGAGRIRLLMGL